MLNLLFVLDFGGTASFLQHDVLFTNACGLDNLHAFFPALPEWQVEECR
jgi:hypothetical protein